MRLSTISLAVVAPGANSPDRGPASTEARRLSETSRDPFNTAEAVKTRSCRLVSTRFGRMNASQAPPGALKHAFCSPARSLS